MRLKPFLPESIWRSLRNGFWKKYWSNVEGSERERLGVNALPLRGSERAVLIEAVCDASPFESLLEIGCGHGQNFIFLAPLLPNTKMLGIDISDASVRGGNELITNLGLINISLVRDDCRNLSRFADKSFDCTICSGFLLYVGPELIERVLKEVTRISKRRIIILEQHLENPNFDQQHLGVHVAQPPPRQGYWLRDYRKLLEGIVKPEQIRITKVLHPIWEAEQWKQYAHLIEVSL